MESKNLKKKWVCPKCGSERVKYIIYGFPDPSKIKIDDVLGSCEISEDSPKWACLAYKHEWGKHLHPFSNS